MTYQYKCECGYLADESRKVDDRNEPKKCPKCGKDMKLKIGAVPHKMPPWNA